MKYNLLIVEDQDDKKTYLSNLLKLHSEFANFDETWVRSISAAYGKVITTPPVDLILLDMVFGSQSSRNISAADSMAGKEILDYLYARGVKVPVIVVTSYNIFGQKGKLFFDSAESLNKYFLDKYDTNYLGLVNFRYNDPSWHEQFYQLVKRGLGTND